MQLQFYALSERRLGSGRGLSDVYYALDGQFVSLSSSCGRESANITYPLQNVQLYPSELQVLFFAMCAAALIGLSLIILSAGKFTQKYEHTAVVNHQSLPLLIGFLSCMLLFTIGTISTEILAYMSWTCNLFNLVKVKFDIFILLIFVSLLFPLFPLAFILFRCNWNAWTICQYLKFTLKMYAVLWLGTFVFLWLIVCSTATLLLVVAYPLHTITLMFIHVTFVFVVTIMYGIAISQAVSVMDRGSGHKRYILLIIVLNGSIGLLTCAMYVGILFWYDLMILQGLSAVEGASAVMVLLPSLVLAILGHLLQKRFFADTGK